MSSPNLAAADKIKTLIENAPTATAGKLQMIGIESIRERLGDRWERSRDQVCTWLERGIGNELRAGDVFYKVEELAYVLLFCDRSIAESQLICAKIAQDVCRKMFGEEESAVRVRSLTCTADKALLGEDLDLEKTLDALLEETGEEQLFSRDGGAGEAPQDAGASGGEGGIGFLSPEGTAVHARLDELSFLYSPVWDVERHVVLTYLCRPSLPDSLSSPLATAQLLATDDPGDQVHLDIHALRECGKRLAELKTGNRRILIACPVHWSTVSRARYWAAFKQPFLDIGAELLQDLVFLVHSIDSGTPNIRLMQELPKLMSGTRGVYASLTYGDKAVDRFVNCRASALGFILPDDITDERVVSTLAREFCVAADGKHFPTFAFGVQTRSLAMFLIGAGYRYLEGGAIRPGVANPRNAFVHETIDLFSKDVSS